MNEGDTQIFQQMIDEDILIPVVAIVFGCLVAIVAITFGTMSTMMKTKAKEESRREIAAYVAEGSIPAGEAVHLMNAGRDPSEIEELKEQLGV